MSTPKKTRLDEDRPGGRGAPGGPGSGRRRAKATADPAALPVVGSRPKRAERLAIDHVPLIREPAQPIHELPRLLFYLYSVSGVLEGERRTFGVVCCHGADARTLVVRQFPAITAIEVERGGRVHYISIGEHTLGDQVPAVG